MRRFLLPFCALPFAVLACGSSSSTPAPSQPADAGPQIDIACEDFASALQADLDAERAKEKIQHAAIAVSTPRCGKRVFSSDDPAAKVKPEADWLWQVGSVTKTFVGSTVLSLVEAGKLGLDDALVKYLPSFPNAANITLRHLLSHTSGIFDYLQAPEVGTSLTQDPGRVLSADELIGFAAAHPPNFEPGKGWAYSNTNFVILGRVIEKATGDELGATLHSRAIGRAGLTHTFFASTEKPVGSAVPGFEGGKDVTTLYHPSLWGAAGAVQATPGDLLDWVEKLYATNDVLTEASRTQMTTPGKTNVSYLGYGLGAMVFDASRTDGNGPGYGHTGSVPGFMTEVVYHPSTKVAIASFAADSKGLPHTFIAATYKELHRLE
jgi:D-alanyl-D-alanine carboxypeptidase